jgi:hypothetical protein
VAGKRVSGLVTPTEPSFNVAFLPSSRRQFQRPLSRDEIKLEVKIIPSPPRFLVNTHCRIETGDTCQTLQN